MEILVLFGSCAQVRQAFESIIFNIFVENFILLYRTLLSFLKYLTLPGRRIEFSRYWMCFILKLKKTMVRFWPCNEIISSFKCEKFLQGTPYLTSILDVEFASELNVISSLSSWEQLRICAREKRLHFFWWCKVCADFCCDRTLHWTFGTYCFCFYTFSNFVTLLSSSFRSPSVFRWRQSCVLMRSLLLCYR